MDSLLSGKICVEFWGAECRLGSQREIKKSGRQNIADMRESRITARFICLYSWYSEIESEV